jgi:hypothetical protein
MTKNLKLEYLYHKSVYDAEYEEFSKWLFIICLLRNTDLTRDAAFRVEYNRRLEQLSELMIPVHESDQAKSSV